jgi:hypothetical protein
MSNNSIIEHRANYYFIELREEYLHICQECSYKKNKSKASSHCKAFILAIMESWTNDKRGKGEDLAIYMTYPQWIEAMYGMFGRCVIIDSLEELIGEGLLSREKHRMYGKDTYKYRLSYQELNRRVKLLPERDPKHTRPKIDASTNRRDNSEEASISRRDTRLKVDDDPSKSRHNIESTKKPNIESNEGTNATNDSANSETSPSSTPSSLIAIPTSKEPVTTRNTSIAYGNVTAPSEPELPSKSTQRNTEPLLSAEGKRIQGYWSRLGFESTSASNGYWNTLSKHITSFEQMSALYEYARSQLATAKDPTVHPGNLVKAVNGWKQKQAPAPEQPTKPKKQKITPEYLASLPL